MLFVLPTKQLLATQKRRIFVKNREEESITFMESNTIGSRLNTEETPPMIPMNDTETEALAEPEHQNNSEIVSFDEALAKIMEKM